MFRSPSRREILRSSAALAGLTLVGCEPMALCVSSAQRLLPPSIVDAHCHVFNASDLSVRGFVRRVVLKDYEDEVHFPPSSGPQAEGALESFASLLVDLLSKGAIGAADEADDIRRGKSLEEAGEQDAFLEVLRDSLGRISRGARDESTVGSGQRELVEAIRGEAGLEAEAFERRTTAEQLLVSDGYFGRHFRWARQLTGRRFALVEELVRLHGGAERVALVTPALVDYAAWLDDEPTSNLESQVAVMDEIQRRASTCMHCFAPFDPWRQIRDTMLGRRPTALEIVKDAVLARGFVGVKLYPPMGFLPLGNASQGISLPKRALDDFGPEFPTMIDDALKNLYAWCEKDQVAVMTHATRSQGANTDYAMRANPEGWRRVLEQFPSLRVNLGHFGHFNDVRSNDDARPWEYSIGEMIALGFQNVYADLSYIDEVLPGATGRQQVVNGFRDFLASFPMAARRLMYGSDWIMIGRERDGSGYDQILAKCLADAGVGTVELSAIYRINALRYLGFVSGSPLVKRLQAYYASRAMDLTRLERLVLPS